MKDISKNTIAIGLLASVIAILAFVLPPTVDLEAASYNSSELSLCHILLMGFVLAIAFALPIITNIVVNRKTYKEEKHNIKQ